MKKKIITILIAIVLMLGMLGSGCGVNGDIVVVVPDGAPALALATTMENFKEYNGHKIRYEVLAGTGVVDRVRAGRANLAIMPTNSAATLFNNGIEIKLVSTAIEGILYMVTKDSNAEIGNIESLVGKVVMSIGQGSTPQYVLEYILRESGIEFRTGDTAESGKVTINYVADGSTIIAAFAHGTGTYGVLGEPAATIIKSRVNGTSTFLDVQEAYSNASGGSMGYPQASLIIKKSTAETYPNLAEIFRIKIDENKAFLLQSDENALAGLESIKSVFAETAITTLNIGIVLRCNINNTKAAEAKISIESFLTVLDIELPAANFYYGG